MLRLKTLLIISILFAGCFQNRANARTPFQSENDKGVVHTRPPADDLGYQLMGEFVGTIKTDGERPQRLGLQLRPLANNRFEAIAYFGGLPGQKNHKTTPMQLIGKRSDGFVVLSGGPWAIFVEKDACQLVDNRGNQIGRLKRVKRRSPTLHSPPPEDSTVLFDGTNVEQFTNGQLTDDGLLAQGADLKPMFQDFNLHVEFRLPYMPDADGQRRANSGLYLQSRYECQILDSFGTLPLINGCGALYQFRQPDLNMCFPPLVWQTYDVQFTAPRWSSDGKKIRNAQLTSWLNGVKVQDNVSLPNKTGAGKQEEPNLLPIRIQNHGDPVRFRNIWIVDRGLASVAFPNEPTKDEIKAAVTAERQRRRIRAKAAKKRAAELKAAAKKEAAKKEATKVEAAKKEAVDREKAAKEKAVAGEKKADADK